jgi:hypothetical protein
MTAIQNLTAADFRQLVASSRARTSPAGDKLSLRELTAILEAAKRTPDVRFAAEAANLTPEDLKAALSEMVAGGTLSANHLAILFDAMLSPKSAEEAGASISAEEAAILNAIIARASGRSAGGPARDGVPDFQLSGDAKKLLEERIAPNAAQMLSVPARTSGVGIRGQSGGMLPTGPRNPSVGGILGDNPTADSEGARKLRVFPANFEIEGKVASTFWDDGIVRSGSWQTGHVSLGRITKMPTDGKLHFTLVSHPSSHNSLNYRHLARSDYNTVDIYIVRPKPGAQIEVPDGSYKAIMPLMSEWEMRRGASNNVATVVEHLQAKDFRNFPVGVDDQQGRPNGDWALHGNEDARPGLDVTLDFKALGVKPGDFIYVGWSPRDPRSGNSTTGFSYSTNRAFGLYVDPAVYSGR